jgi:hypothetical protein
MPHESTVAHEQRFVMETPAISRSRMMKMKNIDKNISPHNSDNDLALNDDENINDMKKNGENKKVSVIYIINQIAISILHINLKFSIKENVIK